MFLTPIVVNSLCLLLTDDASCKWYALGHL